MMSSAKRRINSTGRKRIRRESIDIRMVEAPHGQPLQATASVDLSSYGLPPSAIISIEAYRRSSGMRFECGTVGSPAIPGILVLNEVDQSGTVLFRLKVTDGEHERGRILASAERIQPLNEDENKDRRSLFPVHYRSLGEQIWLVEINAGDRPRLILNREIPDIKHRLQTEAFLQGMLFPAAFRIVMEAIVRSMNDDDEDDESESQAWQAEWLQFLKDGLGIPNKPPVKDIDEKARWIDDAVIAFCNQYGFMRAIRKHAEEASHESATA
jgi:hypothetical protein